MKKLTSLFKSISSFSSSSSSSSSFSGGNGNNNSNNNANAYAAVLDTFPSSLENLSTILVTLLKCFHQSLNFNMFSNYFTTSDMALSDQETAECLNLLKKMKECYAKEINLDSDTISMLSPKILFRAFVDVCGKCGRGTFDAFEKMIDKEIKPRSKDEDILFSLSNNSFTDDEKLVIAVTFVFVDALITSNENKAGPGVNPGDVMNVSQVASLRLFKLLCSSHGSWPRNIDDPFFKNFLFFLTKLKLIRGYDVVRRSFVYKEAKLDVSREFWMKLLTVDDTKYSYAATVSSDSNSNGNSYNNSNINNSQDLSTELDKSNRSHQNSNKSNSFQTPVNNKSGTRLSVLTSGLVNTSAKFDDSQSFILTPMAAESPVNRNQMQNQSISVPGGDSARKSINLDRALSGLLVKGSMATPGQSGGDTPLISSSTVKANNYNSISLSLSQLSIHNRDNNMMDSTFINNQSGIIEVKNFNDSTFISSSGDESFSNVSINNLAKKRSSGRDNLVKKFNNSSDASSVFDDSISAIDTTNNSTLASPSVNKIVAATTALASSKKSNTTTDNHVTKSNSVSSSSNNCNAVINKLSSGGGDLLPPNKPPRAAAAATSKSISERLMQTSINQSHDNSISFNGGPRAAPVVIKSSSELSNLEEEKKDISKAAATKEVSADSSNTDGQHSLSFSTSNSNSNNFDVQSKSVAVVAAHGDATTAASAKKEWLNSNASSNIVATNEKLYASILSDSLLAPNGSNSDDDEDEFNVVEKKQEWASASAKSSHGLHGYDVFVSEEGEEEVFDGKKDNYESVIMTTVETDGESITKEELVSIFERCLSDSRANSGDSSSQKKADDDSDSDDDEPEASVMTISNVLQYSKKMKTMSAYLLDNCGKTVSRSTGAFLKISKNKLMSILEPFIGPATVTADRSAKHLLNNVDVDVNIHNESSAVDNTEDSIDDSSHADNDSMNKTFDVNVSTIMMDDMGNKSIEITHETNDDDGSGGGGDGNTRAVVTVPTSPSLSDSSSVYHSHSSLSQHITSLDHSEVEDIESLSIDASSFSSSTNLGKSAVEEKDGKKVDDITEANVKSIQFSPRNEQGKGQGVRISNDSSIVINIPRLNESSYSPGKDSVDMSSPDKDKETNDTAELFLNSPSSFDNAISSSESFNVDLSHSNMFDNSNLLEASMRKVASRIDTYSTSVINSPIVANSTRSSSNSSSDISNNSIDHSYESKDPSNESTIGMESDSILANMHSKSTASGNSNSSSNLGVISDDLTSSSSAPLKPLAIKKPVRGMFSMTAVDTSGEESKPNSPVRPTTGGDSHTLSSVALLLSSSELMSKPSSISAAPLTDDVNVKGGLASDSDAAKVVSVNNSATTATGNSGEINGGSNSSSSDISCSSNSSSNIGSGESNSSNTLSSAQNAILSSNNSLSNFSADLKPVAKKRPSLMESVGSVLASVSLFRSKSKDAPKNEVASSSSTSSPIDTASKMSSNSLNTSIASNISIVNGHPHQLQQNFILKTNDHGMTWFKEPVLNDVQPPADVTVIADADSQVKNNADKKDNDNTSNATIERAIITEFVNSASSKGQDASSASSASSLPPPPLSQDAVNQLILSQKNKLMMTNGMPPIIPANSIDFSSKQVVASNTLSTLTESKINSVQKAASKFSHFTKKRNSISSEDVKKMQLATISRIRDINTRNLHNYDPTATPRGDVDISNSISFKNKYGAVSTVSKGQPSSNGDTNSIFSSIIFEAKSVLSSHIVETDKPLSHHESNRKDKESDENDVSEIVDGIIKGSKVGEILKKSRSRQDSRLQMVSAAEKLLEDISAKSEVTATLATDIRISSNWKIGTKTDGSSTIPHYLDEIGGVNSFIDELIFASRSSESILSELQSMPARASGDSKSEAEEEKIASFSSSSSSLSVFSVSSAIKKSMAMQKISNDRERLSSDLLDSIMHVVCQGHVDETFSNCQLNSGYLTFQQVMTSDKTSSSSRSLVKTGSNNRVNSRSNVRFDVNHLHLCYFKSATPAPWGVMKSTLLLSIPFQDIISVTPDTGNSFKLSATNSKNNNTNSILLPFQDNICITFRQFSYRREGSVIASTINDDFEVTESSDDRIKGDSTKLFEDEISLQAPSNCECIRSMIFSGRINKQDSPFYLSPSGSTTVIGVSKYHPKANFITEKMRQTIIESYSFGKPIIGIDEFHVTLTFRCKSTLSSSGQGYGSKSSSRSRNVLVENNKDRVIWIEVFSKL